MYIYGICFFRCSGATVIDGKVIANLIKQDLKLEVDKILASGKRPPNITVILVGNDPSSIVYVNNKRKAAHKIGNNTLLFKIHSLLQIFFFNLTA